MGTLSEDVKHKLRLDNSVADSIEAVMIDLTLSDSDEVTLFAST